MLLLNDPSIENVITSIKRGAKAKQRKQRDATTGPIQSRFHAYVSMAMLYRYSIDLKWNHLAKIAEEGGLGPKS